MSRSADEDNARPTAPNQVPFKMLQKAARRWTPVVWGTKRKKYRGLGEMCDSVVGSPGWPSELRYVDPGNHTQEGM
jgi:hypothetical protein